MAWTAFWAAFSSGDVKLAIQIVREGIRSGSKGSASNVISEEDQMRCFKTTFAKSVVMLWARKVMRGCIEGGVVGDGGATLASGSMVPVLLEISPKAILMRPIRVAWRSWGRLPS